MSISLQSGTSAQFSKNQKKRLMLRVATLEERVAALERKLADVATVADAALDGLPELTAEEIDELDAITEQE